MKRIARDLALTASLSILTLNAHSEQRFYIGGGASSGSAQDKTTIKNSSGNTVSTNTLKGDSSAKSFKLGIIDESGGRAELSYSSIDATWNSGGNDSFSGFNFDGVKSFGTGIKPFVTAGVGFYKLKGSGQVLASGEDLKGVAFNLGGGLLVDAGANLELELAYKFKHIRWGDVKDITGRTIETRSNVGAGYLGLNLKF